MIVKKNKIEFNVLKNSWWEKSFNTWEADFFNLLDDKLNNQMIFVDIGSWFGPVTLYASKIVKHVYSIEANPEIFKLLEENILKNVDVFSKINIYNYCLWKENNKEIKMSSKDTAPWDTSTVSAFYSDNEKNNIVSKTIIWDTFIKQNNINKIDFIKMDIEGSEKIVLPTMKDYLIEYKPSLILSIHSNLLNKYDYEIICDCLSHYNYIYDYRNKKEINLSELDQEKNIDLLCENK